MTLNFEGRVAVVTGAGGGLGRCHAVELARRGAHVVVNDLGAAVDGTGTSSAAQAVVDEITAAGGSAIANTDSVATPEGGRAIIGAAVETFGRIDILVNNAGILRDAAFKNMTAEKVDPVIDVAIDPIRASKRKRGRPSRRLALVRGRSRATTTNLISYFS